MHRLPVKTDPYARRPGEGFRAWIDRIDRLNNIAWLWEAEARHRNGHFAAIARQLEARL